MKYLKGEKAEAKYYLVGNATKIQFSLIRSGNRRQIGPGPIRTGACSSQLDQGNHFKLQPRSVLAASNLLMGLPTRSVRD